MDRLRTPFLVIAVVLLVIIVLVETGSRLYIGSSSQIDTLPTPGLGVPYLALVDGIVLFVIGLFGLSVFMNPKTLADVQGVASFVFSLLMLLGSIALIFIALTLLMLMISLLLAVPFGTLAYLAAFATFDLDAARVTLGILMTLKIAVVICLFLAHQTFLTTKGLVILLLTSLLANVVVSFLHGLVPDFLVSILDAIAAIVVGVLAAIWALVKLIGAIPGVVKAVMGLFKTVVALLKGARAAAG
jgi:hypothetical protein